MIPWGALHIQDSARQITLGIVTKLYFPLGDGDLTVAIRVNQEGRTKMTSVKRWWELALWLSGLARQGSSPRGSLRLLAWSEGAVSRWDSLTFVGNFNWGIRAFGPTESSQPRYPLLKPNLL